MSTLSQEFYSNIMEKNIQIVFDHEPLTSWFEKGHYCTTPLYFDLICVIDHKGNEVDYWESFSDIIITEFMKNSMGRDY